jgi:alpha-methylacyl-CoA racemase
MTPVLNPQEAAENTHHQKRQTFSHAFGLMQAAPAPRFSRTPGSLRRAPAAVGEHTTEVLSSWGLLPGEIEPAIGTGAVPVHEDVEHSANLQNVETL